MTYVQQHYPLFNPFDRSATTSTSWKKPVGLEQQRRCLHHINLEIIQRYVDKKWNENRNRENP